MKDLTPERLTRLLALITYLSDGRRVTVEEAADHFAISEAQLLADIDTLWVSGAPGYSHAELLDFEASGLDEGFIQLLEAQQMDRPLRLSAGEAVSLLVALNSLIARLGENPILLRARQKLQLAAGEAARAAEAIHISRTPGDVLEIREVLERAISQERQVWIRYVSGQDEVSERVIDPLILEATGEHWILGSWCHLAKGERNFRLDRILELEERTEQISTSAEELSRAQFDPSRFVHTATLHLRPQARWVLEQIPVEEVIEHEGSFSAVIAGSDPQWLTQLCLRLGDSLIAVDPPQIAQAVAAAARDALNLYEQ